MKKLTGIIESSTPPPTDCLWLIGNSVKYFSNGKWRELSFAESNLDRQELEEKVDSLDKEMGDSNNDIRNLQNDKLSYLQLEIGNSNDVRQHNLTALSKSSGFFFTRLDYGYGVGTYQSGHGGFAHVVTAYDNDTYYDINVDGSITKNENYISPNEPHTVNLDSSKINSALDDITASKVTRCGEIIVSGSTGSITYTRTPDSTSTVIYFTSNRKDGKYTLLTFNVNTKIISSTTVGPFMSAATNTQIGGVKKVSAIEDLVVDSATAESIAYKVNDILSSLRNSGILAT